MFAKKAHVRQLLTSLKLCAKATKKTATMSKVTLFIARVKYSKKNTWTKTHAFSLTVKFSISLPSQRLNREVGK